VALRIVMMGTGGFALPTFRAVLDSRHTTVGLFTQPDRSGRGHHQHRNPLKELAAERHVPVFQPPNVNLPESIEQLRALDPDLCVVAAYGQILSPALIAVPHRGAINVHASLLPRFRGAAPIQAAILHGERETGVTLFQIEPKLDAGPILAIESTPIGPKETSGDLEFRLAEIGAALMIPLLDQVEGGSATPLIQDASRASRAPRLKKESGQIDWNKTAAQIDCHVRAMQPWPMAYSILVRGDATAGVKEPSLRLILLEVDPAPTNSESLPKATPGSALTADRTRLVVQTGDRPLEIVRLRPEGKREMSAAEFLRGYRVEPGDRFETNLSPG